MNKPCTSAALIAASFSLLFHTITLAQAARESMGFAALECENFSANGPERGAHSWSPGNAVPGFSGSGYMEALPGDGTTIIANPATESPELQYAVTFATAGTYYLWMRGHAIDGGSMTLHAGLDGTASTQMTLSQSGAWQWTNAILNSSAPATITIGSAGSHTLSLWMRDSGIKVDKIILTLNPNYSPDANSDFWKNQNIYQIFTDRFFNGDPANDNAAGNFNATNATSVHGGDLKGIEQKLNYVKALGATAIWISPVVRNINGDYHGYAGSDFYNVDPRIGTLTDLQRLVQEAHRMGILVINDIVVNHGSTIVDSANSAYPTTFLYPPSGYTLRYTNPAKQYAPPFDSATTPQLGDLFHNNGLIHNFGDTTQVEDGELSGLDDFRTETSFVRTSMIDIYKYWIENAGFDGFRVDTVKHVEMGFWHNWCPAMHASAVSANRPDFFMFGEVYDGSDAKCGSYTGTQAGGPFTLDSVVDYPLYFTVNSVFANATGNTQQLENRYNGIPANYDPSAQSRLVTFLDNHDQPRFLSSGNANGNTSRLDVALAFLYSSRGIPCLYYGTEQGFDGGSDPNNREDMFAGGFEQGPSVGDNFNMANPLFQSVAMLNNFRRLYPALRTGTHVNQWNDPSGPGLFAYSRRLENQEALVVLNTGGSNQTLPNRPTIYPAGTVLANLLNPSETITVTATPEIPPISMPGTSAKIFIEQSQVLPLDPVVTDMSPAHDTAGVPTASPLVINFSKSMDTASVEAAFSTFPATSGSFIWSTTVSANDTLTYNPGASGWAANTNYAIRIGNSAADSVSGNHFFAAFEARFTTGTTTTQALPPVTTTTAASALGTSSATLNGGVNPNNAATSTWFQYGRTTSYGSTTSSQNIGSGGTSLPVSAGVTGLRSGRTYHFRAVASNANGTTFGADKSFIVPTSGTPANASTNPATGVTLNSAVLNGTVNPNGNATTVNFQYGVTPTSIAESPWAGTVSQSIGNGTSNVAVTAPLTGLAPGTTYYFTVTSTNALGTSVGSTVTFTTLPSPLGVFTSGASDLTTTSATINGAIDPGGFPSTGWFEYGATPGYGGSTRQSASADAEDKTAWDYAANSADGSGLGPASYLEGSGGGIYLANSATGGRQIDGLNSFAIYAGTGGQALARAISAPRQNGTVMLSARFDVSNTTGTTAFNLKSGIGASFRANELLAFGLAPANGNTMIFVRGSNDKTINLGSEIRGAIIDFSLNYDSPSGTYQLGAKFRGSANFTTVSGNLLASGLNATHLGFANFNSGPSQNLIFDDLSVMTSDSVGSGSAPVPFAFPMTGLAPGATYHFRMVGMNNAGIIYGPDATFTTYLPIDQWRQTHFGTTDSNDPVAGDMAAPLGDGIANLIKYALGIDPAAPATGMPFAGSSGGFLTLTFNRQKSATDIVYHVETSGDLGSWMEVWSSATVPYGGGGNPFELVTVSDQSAIGNQPRFMRLKITR
jgi:glycosidase